MKKIFNIVCVFILSSCSNIDFVYDEINNSNPLYGKTIVETVGAELTFMNSYIPMYFGKIKDEEFMLEVSIKEEKTKRSIETNQAASNLNYQLEFKYTLKSIHKNCLVYSKKILSSFSIIPKSSGYNYGTDVSLEKSYELAITENFNQFTSLLSNLKLNSCA